MVINGIVYVEWLWVLSAGSKCHFLIDGLQHVYGDTDTGISLFFLDNNPLPADQTYKILVKTVAKNWADFIQQQKLVTLGFYSLVCTRQWLYPLFDNKTSGRLRKEKLAILSKYFDALSVAKVDSFCEFK